MQRRGVSMLSTARDTLEGDVLEEELEDLHAGLAGLPLFQHETPDTHHHQRANEQGDGAEQAAYGHSEGNASTSAGGGRLIIAVTDSVLYKDAQGQIQVKERTDPLFSVAQAVQANGAASRVHWVCPSVNASPVVTMGTAPAVTSVAVPSDDADAQLSPALGQALHMSTVNIPAHVRAMWLGEYVQLLLWPCMHSLLQPTGGGGLPPFGEPHALASAWAATMEGTRAFAKKIACLVTPQDTVLVADSALLLLPEALRREICLSSGSETSSSSSSGSLNAIHKSNMAMPNIVLAMRTSFPSPEVWRCLPQRAELLQGMLGADLIVLQAFEDARNVSAAAQHVLGLEARPSWVDIQGRFAALSVMPLGIEPELFACNSNAVQAMAFCMRQHLQGAGAQDVGMEGNQAAAAGPGDPVEKHTPPTNTPQKLILAIDSLDMSRGIPQKLLGFETLLNAHPEHKEKVTLVLVITSEPDSKPLVLDPTQQAKPTSYPMQGGKHSYSVSGTDLGPSGFRSRLPEGGYDGMPLLHMAAASSMAPMTSSDFQTATLRKTVHELVGRINGAFATATWLPIRLLSATLSTQQRAALYSISAVGFQVSAREGLTYEALEYIAAQDMQSPGVLLYSDFAGAAGALRGAITVNPFDAAGVGQALHKALSMPNKQRQLRATQVSEYVQATSASVWAARMLVLASAAGQAGRDRRPAQPLPIHELQTAYQAAGQGNGRRLLVFSYNGTLRPYASRPEQAGPSTRLRTLLARLASDPLNIVWVMSGDTTAADMHAWMGDLPIGLAAESGYLYRHPPSQPLASSIARRLLAARPVSAGVQGPAGKDTEWLPPHPSSWNTLFRQPGQASRAPQLMHQAGGQLSAETSAAQGDRPAMSWYEPVKDTFQFFTDRVPGTHLQAQEATLVWSYADAQPDSSFGDAVSRDVLVHLDSILFGQPAEALPAHAKRFIAVRPVGLSKGALLARLLSASDSVEHGPVGSSPTANIASREGTHDSVPFSFLLVAGDERTDEEMYPHARKMNAQDGCSGWAILVQSQLGAEASSWNEEAGAPYYVQDSNQLLDALELLTGVEEGITAKHGSRDATGATQQRKPVRAV